ncbi:MAG: hypothetical protein R3E60_07865 [Alphaproteobacteria bacterium]
MTKFAKLLAAGCAVAALWATGAAAADAVSIKPGTYKGKTQDGKDVEVMVGSGGVTSIKVGGSTVGLRPGTWTDEGWWVAVEPTVNTGYPPNKYQVRPFMDGSIIYASGWSQRNPGKQQTHLWMVK